MPCDDITELVTVRLGANDCLIDFSMEKVTCGGTVGAGMLLPYVQKRHIDDLLRQYLIDFVPQLLSFDEVTQFLMTKQLFGIQMALKAITGAITGRNSDAFKIDAIEYDTEGTLIRGLLEIDLVVEEIPSCSGCHCGASNFAKKLKEARTKIALENFLPTAIETKPMI